MGVAASASERQTGGNVCSDDNGGCSHLCLYRGGGQHVCACPDVPDQRPCTTGPHSEVRLPRTEEKVPLACFWCGADIGCTEMFGVGVQLRQWTLWI